MNPAATASAVAVAVEVLVAGEVRMPSDYVFRPPRRLIRLPALLRPGGARLRAPLLAYVIRHPSAGTVLLDTGVAAACRSCGRRAGAS